MRPVSEGCQSYPQASQSFLHDQEPMRKVNEIFNPN